MAQKVVGVLGGLGPEATVGFFAQIVRRTKAAREQDHLRILIDNNPKVPPRAPAIFGTGDSCVPELVRSARALERAGADFIVVPCVTVHYFHEALQKRSRLPVLHIIEETARRVRRHHRGARKVGLLATTATIRSGLFERAFAGTKVEILVPDESVQEQGVMPVIRMIKDAGATPRSRQIVRRIARGLVARGAEVVITGCTEISLALEDGDLDVPVIDPVAVLAEAAIQRAGARIRTDGNSRKSKVGRRKSDG